MREQNLFFTHSSTTLKGQNAEHNISNTAKRDWGILKTLPVVEE
jgi:hypothetical protein